MRRYLPSLSGEVSQPVIDDDPTISNQHVSPITSYIPSAASLPSVRKYLFASEESVQQQNPLIQLSQLVDETIGSIHNPSQLYASRISIDPMVTSFYSTVEERNQILQQFLRARHNNPKDALAMILSSLKWRKSMNIENYLKTPLRQLLVPNSCFPLFIISTPEKCKQPVIYGLIRLLDKRLLDRQLFLQALYAFLEQCYFLHTYVSEEMIVILDFRDWLIRKHAPFRVVKDGIQTLQDYYPERLDRVFLVNYPASIRAAYTAISPIIDAGAKEKIVWIPDSDSYSILTKYAPPKSIPTFMGGELQPDFPSTWPDIPSEFQQDSSQ